MISSPSPAVPKRAQRLTCSLVATSVRPVENGVPVSFLFWRPLTEWPFSPSHPGFRYLLFFSSLFPPCRLPPTLPTFYLPSDPNRPLASPFHHQSREQKRHGISHYPYIHTYPRPGNLLAANRKTYSERVLLSTTGATSTSPPTGANRTAGLGSQTQYAAAGGDRVLLAAERRCRAAHPTIDSARRIARNVVTGPFSAR